MIHRTRTYLQTWHKEKEWLYPLEMLCSVFCAPLELEMVQLLLTFDFRLFA